MLLNILKKMKNKLNSNANIKNKKIKYIKQTKKMYNASTQSSPSKTVCALLRAQTFLIFFYKICNKIYKKNLGSMEAIKSIKKNKN